MMNKISLVCALLMFKPLAVCAEGGSCAPVDANGNEIGSCRWSYDASTRTISITGTGDMKKYTNEKDTSGIWHTTAPWAVYETEAESVNIAEGITSISTHAFYEMRAINNVSIPSSVISIGGGAFQNNNLTNVQIPEGVNSVGSATFHSNFNLTQVNLPNTLQVLDISAFGGTGIDSLILPESVSTIRMNYNTNIKLYCTSAQMEQCKAVAEETGVEPIEYKKIQNGRYIANGKQYLSAADLQAGNVFTPKLIYTVEEAMEATKNGDKFHVYLTYK